MAEQEDYRRITITIPNKTYEKLLIRTAKEGRKRDTFKFSLSRTISDILEEKVS